MSGFYTFVLRAALKTPKQCQVSLRWGPKVMPADQDNYEMNIIHHGGSVLVPWSFLLCLFGHPQIKALLYKLWHHPSLPHTNKLDSCARPALVSNRLFGHHSSPITIIYLTVENCSNCNWSCGATEDSRTSRTPVQSARALTRSLFHHLQTFAAAVAFRINKMSQPAALWWGEPLGHLDLPAMS